MKMPLACSTPLERTVNLSQKLRLKILLVLPAGERVRVTRECPEVPRRAMLRFSVLPLTAVAALTPREHEVRIIDENVEPLNFDADCDVVGITFMTALAPRAYEIADHFRRRGQVVVAGGYHATLYPEDAAPHFDALVLGDAEGAWERLLADLGDGKLKKLYRQADIGDAGQRVHRARCRHRFLAANWWRTRRGTTPRSTLCRRDAAAATIAAIVP